MPAGFGVRLAPGASKTCVFREPTVSDRCHPFVRQFEAVSRRKKSFVPLAGLQIGFELFLERFASAMND